MLIPLSRSLWIASHRLRPAQSDRGSFLRPGRFVVGSCCLALSFTALAAQSDQAVPPGTQELIYGGDQSFPPYEFLDAGGEPAGLNIDLMRAIARHRGFQVQFKLMPWPHVRAALDRGLIDVTAMYRSTQRATEVSFAIPHELVYHEMYVRKGSPPLRTLENLQGKRILVQNGTYSMDMLTALGHADRLLPRPSEPDALQALAQGEGDVAIVTQTVGRPFERRQLTGTKIVATGSPVLLNEYAFVTRLGRHDLIELLNDGVVAVKTSGEYEDIYDHWVRPGREGARWVRWLTWGLGITGALVVWFVLWNWALRQRVARQTRALRQEFEKREVAQHALAENERQLRRAQRMETVGRLAGGVAHDFNNILTVILNYANFLRADLAAAGQPTDDANEILAAAERATRLTRQLLAFSRETPMELVRLDLRVIVRELSGMIQRLVGEDVAIEIAAPGEPVVAAVDRSGIEQALLNLAANARDAMERHGRLTIKVGHRALAADNPLQLSAGDYVTISVQDTGSGMDEKTLAHLAEPFFTTKEVGKGTGLGLASVFATMAKHGGKVAVQTAVGRGSTFEIVLPKVDAPVVDSAVTSPVVPTSRVGTGQTVLLVEDDEPLRRAAQIALDRCGYRVVEARDGEHALELVDRGLRFQVLVTDVVMPRINGPKLVAELRQRIGDVLVLYASGYVQKEASLDLDAPGTGFLAKPFAGDQLVEAVRQLLAGSRRPGRAVPRLIV